MASPTKGSPRGAARPSRPLSAKSRLRWVMVVMLVLLLVITGKLFLIQGLDAGSMAEAAVSQRTVVQKLPATRGKILDANGRVMAESIIRYNITVSPKNNTGADDFQRVIDKELVKIPRAQGLKELADVLGMSVATVTEKATGTSNFAYIAMGVTPAIESKVMDLGLPGIYSEPVSERTYPDGAVGGSIVGFTSKDGQALAGIEQTMDAKLAGKDGEREYQRGANGIVIPTAPVDTTPAVDGQSVRLTINQDIQYYAQQAAEQQKKQYSADWANIVVVEAKTGRVIALADTNSLDPNNPGASKAADIGVRAVTGAVEPGSTEKTVTAAAAIEQGLISADSHILIPPTYTVDGQTFSDAFSHGTEQRTFAGVIGDSLNTGTVMVGQKLTPQERYDWLRKFGIGQATGIELPGENPGILATPDKWDGRQQYTVLFGQGVAQTPLQTAMIYQAIANNGVRLKPQLIDAYIDPDGTEHKVAQQPGTEVITPKTAAQVRDILESVTTIADATNVVVPGYRVGGKTGTAEAPAENGVGFDGYTSSFVGMAPMDNPEYVVLITVQRPKTNIYGVNQGYTFNDVMGQVLRTFNVPPSTTPSIKLPQYY
ncbi:peptidoglycan D,D-transpeptidase FtsI family protein [Pseudarthrobacter sp. P1]|uniref:peptidoglycan D,D-transpeptidase FtsI family protein n=1 Tax=Pseudarthrobacter sp. P1 TaxID=3418418 RepID=UPI003CECC108